MLFLLVYSAKEETFERSYTPEIYSNELIPKMAILQAGVTFFSMPVILGYIQPLVFRGVYISIPPSLP